jgi:hypothetical protein
VEVTKYIDQALYAHGSTDRTPGLVEANAVITRRFRELFKDNTDEPHLRDLFYAEVKERRLERAGDIPLDVDQDEEVTSALPMYLLLQKEPVNQSDQKSDGTVEEFIIKPKWFADLEDFAVAFKKRGEANTFKATPSGQQKTRTKRENIDEETAIDSVLTFVSGTWRKQKWVIITPVIALAVGIFVYFWVRRGYSWDLLLRQLGVRGEEPKPDVIEESVGPMVKTPIQQLREAAESQQQHESVAYTLATAILTFGIVLGIGNLGIRFYNWIRLKRIKCNYVVADEGIEIAYDTTVFAQVNYISDKKLWFGQVIQIPDGVKFDVFAALDEYRKAGKLTDVAAVVWNPRDDEYTVFGLAAVEPDPKRFLEGKEISGSSGQRMKNRQQKNYEEQFKKLQRMSDAEKEQLHQDIQDMVSDAKGLRDILEDQGVHMSKEQWNMYQEELEQIGHYLDEYYSAVRSNGAVRALKHLASHKGGRYGKKKNRREADREEKPVKEIKQKKKKVFVKKAEANSQNPILNKDLVNPLHVVQMDGPNQTHIEYARKVRFTDGDGKKTVWIVTCAHGLEPGVQYHFAGPNMVPVPVKREDGLHDVKRDMLYFDGTKFSVAGMAAVGITVDDTRLQSVTSVILIDQEIRPSTAFEKDVQAGVDAKGVAMDELKYNASTSIGVCGSGIFDVVTYACVGIHAGTNGPDNTGKTNNWGHMFVHPATLAKN